MSFDMTTLGEYIDIQGGYAYKSKDFVEFSNNPVLKIKNIRSGYIDYNDASYISDELAGETIDWIAQKGDILISMTGSGPNAPNSLVGRVAMVWENKKSWVNQRVGKIRIKQPQKIDANFVFYILSQKQAQDFLVANSTGSANQANINASAIKSIPCPVITYVESKKIADFIIKLDKKITLNNQINETLEAMAQALFKSWFIDFEPVKAKMEAKDAGADETEILLAAMSAISGKDLEALKTLQTTAPEEYAELKAIAEQFPDSLEESELGLIPKGWKITDIGSVCHFQNGNAFKSKELIKEKRNSYKVFKMGGIQKGGGFKEPSNLDFYPKNNKLNYDQYLIQKGDLLMCMTDMKNNVALLGHTAIMPINNEYLLNQRVGRIRTRNKTIVNFPFLYLLTNDKGFLEDLRSRANSGVQVNLSTKSITESSFILPLQNIHLAFNKIMEEAFEVIFKNMKQNKTLTELRDTLLPKLLSGEIDVSNVEIDELLER